MGALVKLGIRLNVFCIIGMVIAAIAVYACGLGGQIILGVHVFTILAAFTLASMVVSFLQDLIFKPSLSGQAAKLAKQAIMLLDESETMAGRVLFANSVIDAVNKNEKVRYRLSAIVGIVADFIFGPIIGSPFAEWIALAVLLIGPSIVGLIMHGTTMRIRALDSDLFDETMKLYSSAHGSIFGPV